MPTPSHSRFKKTPVISVDGVEAYGRWVSPGFLNEPPKEFYTVSNAFAGKPHLIADDLFSTPEYFWAIIAYNAPRNPFNWPAAGEVIRIPSLQSIVAEL